MEEEKLIAQLDLEQFLSKRQLIPRIKAEFVECKEVNFNEYFAEAKIPQSFGYDLLVQMVIHKRTTLPTLVGILRHHFDDSQVTADMLMRAAEADLMDWIPDLKIFVVRIDISPDVQQELDEFAYPLPMIVPPKHLKTNLDSGYYSTRGSVILKDNHHDDDVCLDYLNKMNSIKLSLDNDTATMIKNRWRNLDKPKVGESHDDFQRRRKQFEKYDRTAKAAIALLQSLNDHFYLTHKYDKRGRSYCCGYQVNYQGNPWSKAVINLYNTELVT
jgi:hypothetical protein